MASYNRTRIYPNVQANVELSAYIRLPTRSMRCSQLGGYLRRYFNLQGFVEVREHGNRWYSATFSSQLDYDQVFLATSGRIFGRYSIELYRWQPNFQFGQVPPFFDGGSIVEGRVEGLPLEYWRDDVMCQIANAVCQPLGCRAFMVDTRTEGKLPRFLFESNGFHLPLHIQVHDGPVVGLSYSLPQKCYSWDGYGHSRLVSNPDPRQWTTSFTPSSSGYGRRTQVHRRPSPNVDQDENGIASSSGITSPPRTIAEKEMPDKGATIIEKGGESRPTLYTLGKDVSEIDVAVKVTHSNDQRGNLRHVAIIPHLGDGPKYIKRVICASIDGADATRTLEEMCHNKGASLIVVLDKSSVLDDQIGSRLGFSAFHRAEMNFRRVGEDGSALDVKGNCLLMWKREEVCVDISAVDTGPSSQHVKFSASWLFDESNEEEPDGLSHGVTTCAVEGPSKYSDSTTPGSSDGPDLEGSFSNPTAPEELSSEFDNVSPIDTPGGDALTSNYGDTSSGEERPSEASTSSSSRSESLYSGPAVYDESPPGSPDSNASSLNYGDTDADGSSGDESLYESNSEEDFSTDAEEISCGHSAPFASKSSSSEEGNFSSPDGDNSSAPGMTNSLLPLDIAVIPKIFSPDAERDKEGTSISEEQLQMDSYLS